MKPYCHILTESCFPSFSSKGNWQKAQTGLTLLSGPWPRHWTFDLTLYSRYGYYAGFGHFHFPVRLLRCGPETWGEHAGEIIGHRPWPLLIHLFLPEKTGQLFFFHGDIPVGTFIMHVVTVHLHPLNNLFVFILIMCHIVFLCTVFHFYKPLYWCPDEQYMLHTSSTLISLYMKLYFYKTKKMLICIRASYISIQP